MFNGKAWLTAVVVGIIMALMAVDAYAKAEHRTKKKCNKGKWQYMVKVKTKCKGGLTDLCKEKEKEGCSLQVVECPLLNCYEGGDSVGAAHAKASNGPDGFSQTTFEQGQAKAGKGGSFPPDTVFSSGEFYGHVEFDSVKLEAVVTFDSGSVVASIDSTYYYLEIKGYVQTDSTDTLITPSNTFWEGALLLQDGVLSFSGSLTDDNIGYDPATGVLVIVDTKTINIPFPGTAQEFEDAVVSVVADGGYGQFEPWPSPIPTLTEWGMIIFGVVLLGFISWVFLKRRKATVSLR
jgi:hypothetical protein